MKLKITIMIISCRIFEYYALTTLLLFWPLGLTSQISVLAPSLFIDLGADQTKSALLSMSTSKHHLEQKYMFVYFVYYTYLQGV